MYIEIFALGLILFLILTVNGYIKPNKFIQDNQDLFKKLKEDDYEFLVRAKYGDGVDPDVLFEKRIKNGLIAIVCIIFVMLQNLNAVKVVVAFVGGYAMFKLDYMNLKKYYKVHLQKIDSMLPYYLKGLEILYVPFFTFATVASAPSIFIAFTLELSEPSET